jgi:hypothetical protein
MTLAKEYGADRIWIVNVGHFKGLEFPVEYFMHLAWDTKRWTNGNIDEYTRLWTAREFGSGHAREIAEMISAYSKFNGRRKPELLEPTTYSLTNYLEADRVLADYQRIAAKAENIFKQLPENARDAFYELVLFPTKACEQVNALYIAVGKNALYAQQGRASTNDLADRVEALFKADADLMDYFNHKLAGGKWNHFMDQMHIGYTIWQDPPKNVMPRVRRLQLPESAAMGVAVEGSISAWPGASGEPVLPRYDPYGQQRHYIDVFNRGRSSFQFIARASAPWILIGANKETVAKEIRLWVSIDWPKAPKGSASGFVNITKDGGDSVNVKIEFFNPASIKSEDGFIEGDGYVSMEAEHYTRNIPAGKVRWERIDDYGRTLSAMSIIPATAASVLPPKDSPCLEYKMYLHESGTVSVLTTVAPTLNFVPGRGLRYAVSFDDQQPQVVEIVPENFDARNGNKEWEQSVKDASRIIRSSHTLPSAGLHTLKIWMVDSAVVLEKIVVDLGGLKPSYLGPLESVKQGQ